VDLEKEGKRLYHAASNEQPRRKDSRSFSCCSTAGGVAGPHGALLAALSRSCIDGMLSDAAPVLPTLLV